jgi:excisionase family DNA binding protein
VISRSTLTTESRAQSHCIGNDIGLELSCDKTMKKIWITTAEASELSGYHPDHVRRLIRSGEIKAQKFGIVWQVSRASLLSYLHEMEGKGGRRGPKPKGI